MSDDHGRFIWYELMTPDVAAAKRFYGEVVGWTAQDMPMPDMTYTLFNVSGQGVAGAMALTADHKAQGIPVVGYFEFSGASLAMTVTERTLGPELIISINFFASASRCT